MNLYLFICLFDDNIDIVDYTALNNMTIGEKQVWEEVSGGDRQHLGIYLGVSELLTYLLHGAESFLRS